jgi:hypothetical protein
MKIGMRKLYTKGETIQKPRIHKIEIRKTNIKIILRNISQVIRK